MTTSWWVQSRSTIILFWNRNFAEVNKFFSNSLVCKSAKAVSRTQTLSTHDRFVNTMDRMDCGSSNNINSPVAGNSLFGFVMYLLKIKKWKTLRKLSSYEKEFLPADGLHHPKYNTGLSAHRNSKKEKEAKANALDTGFIMSWEKHIKKSIMNIEAYNRDSCAILVFGQSPRKLRAVLLQHDWNKAYVSIA